MATKALTRALTRGVQARYGENRETMRVPFGLGAEPPSAAEWNAVRQAAKAQGLGAAAPMPGSVERCLRCGFGNVQVVEEIVWTIALPMQDAVASGVFSEQFTQAAAVLPNAGIVSAVDSTYLINGILQTDLFLMGIGVHVFVEPQQVTFIGNGFVTADLTSIGTPPSPDVYTFEDLASGSLGGAAVTSSTITPAFLSWGNESEDAGWNFINAYQLLLRTAQRELMINELLADVSYFAAFGDVIGAGTSEKSVTEYAALVNEVYAQLGGTVTFLPANFRRYGSVFAGNGLFHATNDFQLAPVTRGGMKFAGYGCRGQMYRQLERPCFIERGIPYLFQYVACNSIHYARFLAAISLNSQTPSFNLLPAAGVTAFTLTATSGPFEQSLDCTTCTNTPQAAPMARQVFKGGIFKLGQKLKGYEMPAKWKAWCQANLPSLLWGGGSSPPAGGGQLTVSG